MSEQAKPTIVVSDVLKMLDQGQNREEIREHYGLSKADLKRLFENPNLKNKKSRKKPGFILEDDITPENTNETASQPGPGGEEASDQPSDGPIQSNYDEEDFRNPGNTSDDASSEDNMDGIPVR